MQQKQKKLGPWGCVEEECPCVVYSRCAVLEPAPSTPALRPLLPSLVCSLLETVVGRGMCFFFSRLKCDGMDGWMG